MNPMRFDAITRLFAARSFSRRQAFVQGSAGVAAGAIVATSHGLNSRAQEATPSASGDETPTMLFVQAFQSGSVSPKEGSEGRYILTLEHGLGHTVYFSDRPERIVGSATTPEFLAELGFPEDNPPNATLVVEKETGQTEVVVLELFAPAYDEATHTAIYEVVVLAAFERSADDEFGETEADLTELLPEFGASHLFIDDCASACEAGGIQCTLNGTAVGNVPNQVIICCGGFSGPGSRLPSTMWSLKISNEQATWNSRCNSAFAACGGSCTAGPFCPS